MRSAVWIGIAAVGALVSGPSSSPRAQGGAFWSEVQRGDTRKRDRAVEEGNLHLREAKGRRTAFDRGLPPRNLVFDPARAALQAYERALAIGPEDADVHYRALVAAELIIEGTPELCRSCRDGYLAVVRHIDALRRLDPQDTREVGYAWQMAVVLSKLGGLGGPDAAGYFERAIREYEQWRRLIDETDSLSAQNSLSTSYGNAAELLMAVGRLDEAIALYQTAIELNPLEALGYFGLAVAYDRDGQWNKAVATMQEALNRPPGITRLDGDGVFFVPEGDKWYYHALAHQVMGSDRDHVASFYLRFLAAAGDSKYHARAREHLAELGRGGTVGGTVKDK